MERSLTKTVKVSTVARLGTRQMTRAHLAIERRQGLRADAGSALAAVAEQLSKQLGVPVKASARLVDSSVVPSRTLSALCGFAELELSRFAETALVEVELSFLASVLSRLSGASAAPAAAFTLTKLEEAAFGYLCLVAISGLRTSPAMEAVFAPRLIRVHANRAQAVAACSERWRWMAIEVSLEVGGQSGRARVILPAEPVQSALLAIPEDRASTIAPSVLQASLPARIHVGRTRLDRESLAQLGVGDVVLLEQLQLKGAQLVGSARISVSGFELKGQLTADGFSVSSAAPSGLPQERFMSEVSSAASVDAATLSVDLEVELTRLRLPLAELSTLRPGAIINLRRGVAEPVLLWVGDRAVAKAELVEVEGELGARILTLTP